MSLIDSSLINTTSLRDQAASLTCTEFDELGWGSVLIPELISLTPSELAIVGSCAELASSEGAALLRTDTKF